MLISKSFLNDFGKNKKKRTFSKNVLNKTILIIIPIILISLYLISKSNYVVNLSKFDFFNKFLISNGFVIKNIEITGIKHLNKNEIFGVLKSSNDINIFGVDIQKIHEEIIKNTWVKDASIEIIYPNTIKILLNEKKPIAIWQNKYGNNLITNKGEIILEKQLNNFKNNLPIIIGKNAHKNFNSILKILNINKNFAKNIWSLTFVNERRWDIHFNQGLTIRLPNKKVKKAWQQIISINQNLNILNIGLIEIDLRNSDQILGKINIDKKLIFKKKI